MKSKMKMVAFVATILCIGILIVGIFIMQSKKVKNIDERPVDVSQVTEILLKDIDKSYPPTPKEVLKYYSEITCCFYNSGITQEDLEALAKKSYVLYDDELKDNMPYDVYFENLQQDVLDFKSQGIVISGYSTSAATDVEKFTQDGSEWARLYATYRLRQGTEYIYSNEVFIMRKDSNGHWKIYGFDLVKEEEGNTSSEEMVEKE